MKNVVKSHVEKIKLLSKNNLQKKPKNTVSSPYNEFQTIYKEET